MVTGAIVLVCGTIDGMVERGNRGYSAAKMTTLLLLLEREAIGRPGQRRRSESVCRDEREDERFAQGRCTAVKKCVEREERKANEEPLGSNKIGMLQVRTRRSAVVGASTHIEPT